MNGWQHSMGTTAASASASDRGTFLVKTYVHLFGAFTVFLMLSAVWLATPVAGLLFSTVFANQVSMLLFMLAFVAAGYAAQRLARSETSVAMQYGGLGLYVVIESILFTPLWALALTASASDALIIPKALLVTLVLFGMMSATVFLTRKDFSWMRGVLMFGALAMVVFALVGLVAGFSMPLAFMWFGVVLACGYLLYDTSNVLHHYRTTQHVAASLALFASLAMLLWYVLRIMTSRRG